jgi:hypothetical protein
MAKLNDEIMNHTISDSNKEFTIATKNNKNNPLKNSNYN